VRIFEVDLMKILSSLGKPKNIIYPLFSILVFIMITSTIPASAVSCDCVIFRFVDIQDFWLNTARIDVLNTFISEDEKVSLSIILNSIGNDTSIINKVAQGQQSGHFELTLHGFNHENFVTFNATEQKNLMELSQSKMQSLWGINSTSFVPPMHQFNNDTLQVMKDLNIPIISSGPQGIDPPENIKFIANPPSNITDSFGNYHLPQTAEFKDHGTIPHTKILHDDIMTAVNQSISTYGYSVLNLYGTDFAQINSTSGEFDNITNSTEINDLLAIINAIRTNGYTITTFEEITQAASSPTTANLTIIKDVVNDNNGTNVPGDFTMVITANNPSGNNFAGVSGAGNTITIDPGSYSVDETGPGGYFATFSAECEGTAVAGESFTCTITNDDGFCDIPESGDWTVIEDCVLATNSSVPANVIVQNTSILTIPSGVILDIDFSQFNLTVEFGSGVLIRSGGTVT
jgi:peptidoglycan/xylan/chitin deacetylase (PgdA/CDA1 family)